MKRSLLVLAFLFVSQAAAQAVSLSGIVLHAADDFGNPNGLSSFDGELQAQLWRTSTGGIWHGLGVWQGAPPDCFGYGPANAPDFNIDIPLNDGENILTMMGEEGVLTRTDDYLTFSLNLYFDGAVNSAPGISVLFPKFAAPIGGAIIRNRTGILLTLGLQQVDPKPQTVYDDGVNRVTVTAACFLPPERFNKDFNFDFMRERSFGKSGKNDYIGIIKIMVELSQTDGTDPSQPAVGPGPAVGRGGTGAFNGGGGAVPGYPSGAGVPAGGGYAGANDAGQAFPTPRGAGQLAPQRAQPTPVHTPDPDAEPTPVSEESPTAVATPNKTTTAATPNRGTPTAPAGTRTALSGTPTAARSGTPNSGTMTPSSVTTITPPRPAAPTPPPAQ